MHVSIYTYFRAWLKLSSNKTPLGEEFFSAFHVTIQILYVLDTCLNIQLKEIYPSELLFPFKKIQQNLAYISTLINHTQNSSTLQMTNSLIDPFIRHSYLHNDIIIIVIIIWIFHKILAQGILNILL